MMAKKPEDRIQSMWDVLKTLRGTKIFKKPPRIRISRFSTRFQRAAKFNNLKISQRKQNSYVKRSGNSGSWIGV